MRPSEPRRRAWLRLTLGVGGLMVTLDRFETVAQPIGTSGPERVAVQHIPAAGVETVPPAALDHDGRRIGFVARTSDPPQRCCQHVFVLDTSTGGTRWESATRDGIPGNGDSQAPSLSADGQFLAFATTASNLITGATLDGRQRVIVRDRGSGLMRSPRGAHGEEPDGETREPSLSGDGRAVAFTSDAPNLMRTPDANGPQTDVYLWRLDDAVMTRISVDSKGVQPAIGASHSPSLSHDGRRVAFVSTARLAPEDTDETADVYLRDLRRGVTSLVGRAARARRSDSWSHSPALSADGGHVAFVSNAGNLVSGDRNQDADVFVFDVATGTVTLVSGTAKGSTGNAGSRRPRISGDGRYVVYQSLASNLGGGPRCPRPSSDRNLLPDVYLWDRATRCVTRISGSSAQDWWTPSVAPTIDAAGSLIVFSSSHPGGEQHVSTDLDLFLFRLPRSNSAHVEGLNARTRK